MGSSKRMVELALLLAASACGKVTQGAVDAQLPFDAAASDAAAADAAAEVDAEPSPDAKPPRCSKTAPFGAPVPVAELNTSSHDGGARLTQDELAVYFSSDRSGGMGATDIYLATRTSTDSSFDPPSLLAGVNTAGNEYAPSPTADELNLYFSGGTYPNRCIYRATRASVGDSFSGPSLVTELCVDDDEAEPYVMPDHSAIYFPRVYQTNFYDLFVANRGSGGIFDTPVRIAGTNLNTADLEALPLVSNDQLTIYFARGGNVGAGGWDIWMARRSSPVVGFDAPVNLTTLNSTDNDAPTWISDDECVLYLERETAANGWEILVAVRGE